MKADRLLVVLPRSVLPERNTYPKDSARTRTDRGDFARGGFGRFALFLLFDRKARWGLHRPRLRRREARLQRFHQIDHLRARLLRLGGNLLAAFDLPLNLRFHAVGRSEE